MKTNLLSIALSALAIVTATAADTVRRPFKLDLKQPGGITTAVGFVRQGPPPWLDGNCLVIGKWTVLNMHAENMGAFRAKFQVDELDVLPISDRQVVVTDARVGREWFRPGLCEHCIPLPKRLEIRGRHQKYFQKVPGEELLVGSVWELVDRRDMSLPKFTGRSLANIVAFIVPGERLRFEDSTVACATAAGAAAGGRSWELTQNGGQIMLNIYLLKDKVGHFDAIRFRVDKLDEELNLVPHEWMTWDAGGKGWSMLHGEDHKSRVIYRRITQPKAP